jgi:hypothetical protein
MAVIEIACNYGQFRDRRVPQLHRVAFEVKDWADIAQEA